jgi:hypothetical protein
MNRTLTFASFAWFAIISVGQTSVSFGQDDGEPVELSLSDEEVAPLPTLPILDDAKVFKLLLGNQSGVPKDLPSTGSRADQSGSLAAKGSLVDANFASDDKPGQTTGGDKKSDESEIELPTTVLPLISQQNLFKSLWGANDREESENRFDSLRLSGSLRLGDPVRTTSDEIANDRLMEGGFYTWAAPDLYHHPLYFEQVNLERYGQGPNHALQPLFSAAHFFGTIPKLPYHVVTNPPRERVYTLGHYRPGNCAPYQWHRTRFSWKGAIVQGLATAGTAVAIP